MIISKIVYTSIGWIGALFCTLGYVLLSMQLIRAESLLFQLLNILGGLFLSITALETSDMPNVIANLLWMLTGMIALGRYLWNRRRMQ
jgi:uncharacterized protein with PQ loop repeat